MSPLHTISTLTTPHVPYSPLFRAPLGGGLLGRRPLRPARRRRLRRRGLLGRRLLGRGLLRGGGLLGHRLLRRRRLLLGRRLLRRARRQIGRAHVCTPVTNAHLVCRLLLEKKKIYYNVRHTIK